MAGRSVAVAGRMESVTSHSSTENCEPKNCFWKRSRWSCAYSLLPVLRAKLFFRLEFFSIPVVPSHQSAEVQSRPPAIPSLGPPLPSCDPRSRRLIPSPPPASMHGLAIARAADGRLHRRLRTRPRKPRPAPHPGPLSLCLVNRQKQQPLPAMTQLQSVSPKPPPAL